MSNEKPVFTTANMSSVAQEEVAPINDVQPDIQTEQIGLSEDKQGEPISETLESETIEPESVIKQALSPEKISQEKIAEPELKQQGKAPSLPEPLTSDEIASLITMPPSIHAPPPLEHMR
ncbi:MAG: hypothetical protein VW299_00170, partial [Alphaproteobacteria bacterium]